MNDELLDSSTLLISDSIRELTPPARPGSATMSRDPRHSAVLKDLRERLRQIDRSRAPVAGGGGISSTGVAALDALLPATAFRAGMIVEWVREGAGSGAARLALPMAIEALQRGGALVVIDDRREFYPPAAL